MVNYLLILFLLYVKCTVILILCSEVLAMILFMNAPKTRQMIHEYRHNLYYKFLCSDSWFDANFWHFVLHTHINQYLKGVIPSSRSIVWCRNCIFRLQAQRAVKGRSMFYWLVVEIHGIFWRPLLVCGTKTAFMWASVMLNCDVTPDSRSVLFIFSLLLSLCRCGWLKTAWRW